MPLHRRARALAIIVSVVASVAFPGASAQPVAPHAAAAAAPGAYCSYAWQAGLDTYRWTGAQDDKWDDPRNWTKNGTPLVIGQLPPGGRGNEQPFDDPGNPVVNTSRSRDYVCIPPGSSVHLGPDVEGWNARIQALDVAGTPAQPTHLHIGSGAVLRVYGSQVTRPSVIRGNVTVLLNGALGGQGRIDLRGTIQARNVVGAPAFLTRRCGGETSACQTAPAARGLLVVGNTGRVLVDVMGLNILDYYRIRVHGLVQLSNQGYIAADHGTRFELLPATDGGAGTGTLQMRNDGGYYEGATPPVDEGLSDFVNNGRILKSGGAGTSVVSADYTASAASVTRVAFGTIVLPDGVVRPASVAAGRRYGTAVCTYVGNYACQTVTDPGVDLQSATLRVPAADSDGASVRVTEFTGADPYLPPGAVGNPVTFHATQLTATASAPAVIELRYDDSLLAGQTPQTMVIERLPNGASSYQPVPTCLGGGTPPGVAVACVDRRGLAISSRWAPDDPGDLIMVVRTRATSRWVGH